MISFTPANELKTFAKHKPFEGIFLLRKRSCKTARNGSPYYFVELGDKTGTFSTNIFQGAGAIFEIFNNLSEGDILKVEGKTDAYQEKFAPELNKVEKISLEDLANYGLEDQLLESSPEDFDTLCKELEDHINAIPNEAIRAVTRDVLNELGELFKNSSAAIVMHHAYRHGLLEHSNHLARAAWALLPLYPEVDPSLAIAGALLHDIGKTLEYTQGIVTKKTRVGILQGHVVLGYRILRRHCIKNKLPEHLCERLEHIILSHQGELEWGAAAIAATPEAVFVSLVDNLDAKLGMVQAALRNALPESEFSEFIPGLKSALLLTKPEDKSTCKPDLPAKKCLAPYKTVPAS